MSNRIWGCWLVSIRMMTFQWVFGHWPTSTLGSKKPLPKLKILRRLGVIWDQVQHFGHTLDGDPKSEELTAHLVVKNGINDRWLQTQTGYCRIFFPIGQLFVGKTRKIYYSRFLVTCTPTQAYMRIVEIHYMIFDDYIITPSKKPSSANRRQPDFLLHF